MKSELTPGEYNALVVIWRHSPTTHPRGVQERTLWNLVAKGFLICEVRRGGYEWYWLSDSGKVAMDRHPHQHGIEAAAVNAVPQ